MSDDTNNKPTLTRKPLTLSRSLESGEVKQTFSHGRTNKVVVEVKRKKLVGKPGTHLNPKVAAPRATTAATTSAACRCGPCATPAPKADMLSRQERQAKLLREAEEARLAHARRKPSPRGRGSARPCCRRRKAPRRRKSQGGRSTCCTPPEPLWKQEPEPAVSNDDGAAPARHAALPLWNRPSVLRLKQVRDVVVPEAITVQELANRMAEKGSDLVKALFKMGMPVTINETIDQDTAELLVDRIRPQHHPRFRKRCRYRHDE
jgi:translation initiation factor IF-2